MKGVVTTAAEIPHPDDMHDSWKPDGWRQSPPAGESWLSDADLDVARTRLPLVYIDAIPVRVDNSGDVVAVGILLRMTDHGLSRALISGRVNYHERIRDALLRHIEKDLGPMALPHIPASPQPFTVAEYFPTPGITAFHDARQHAVSLAYVVPVTGDCHPTQDAIDIDWVTPEQACSDSLLSAFSGGQGALVRQAMAWCGRI